jgi:hypothetical protein
MNDGPDDDGRRLILLTDIARAVLPDHPFRALDYVAGMAGWLPVERHGGRRYVRLSDDERDMLVGLLSAFREKTWPALTPADRARLQALAERLQP